MLMIISLFLVSKNYKILVWTDFESMMASLKKLKPIDNDSIKTFNKLLSIVREGPISY